MDTYSCLPVVSCIKGGRCSRREGLKQDGERVGCKRLDQPPDEKEVMVFEIVVFHEE